MSKNKDILLEDINIQKSGRYYKIPLPPEKIREESIYPKGYYQITLHLRGQDKIEYEDLVFPSGIQKQGNYYKIALPPDYIKYSLVLKKRTYDIKLHLLFLPLDEGVYTLEKGGVQRIVKDIDDKDIKQVF